MTDLAEVIARLDRIERKLDAWEQRVERIHRALKVAAPLLRKMLG